MLEMGAFRPAVRRAWIVPVEASIREASHVTPVSAVVAFLDAEKLLSREV